MRCCFDPQYKIMLSCRIFGNSQGEFDDEMTKKMIMMSDDLQAKTSTHSEHLNIFPIKVFFLFALNM